MRFLAALLLIVPGLAAQAVDLRGVGRAWTELGAPASERLRLNLDAGAIAIRPSADGQVRLRYTGRRDQDLSRVRVRFEAQASTPELRVSNTPHEDFHLEIEVPRKVALTLRMSAGDLSLQGIEGDKDLRLQAGELKLKVEDAAAYGPVSASVWAGEVNPGPFGASKGGLFRTFSHQGPGRYAIQVKVKAGEIRFLP